MRFYKKTIPTKHDRICIIRRGYFPYDNLLRRNSNCLIAAGYQVDIVCLRNRGEPAAEKIKSVNVYRLPIHSCRSGLLTYFVEYLSFFLMAVVKVSWLHLRHPYSVIEADSMPDFLVFAGILARLTGAQLILYLFESMPELSAQKWGVSMSHWTIKLLLWQERISCHFADEVICCHDMAREALIHRGIPDHKITVILNVSEEQVFICSQFGGQEGSGVFRLIQHGTITENYGIQVVLHALALLDLSFRIKFDVVGWGEHRPVLDKLSKTLGLQDHVEFHGFVSEDRLLKLIHRADAGLVPMLFEYQSPTKMFEYVALKKPVIASDRKTFRQHFNESEVLYFRTGDHRDLARMIEYAFHQPNKMQERAILAWRRYEKYRWENIRDCYLGIYKKSSCRKRGEQ